MILFFLHQELFIFLVFASLLCEKSRCSWYKFSLSVFVNRFWYRIIKGSIKIPLSFHFFKYIFFRRPVIILIEFLSKKEECRVRWASFVWINKIFTLFTLLFTLLFICWLDIGLKGTFVNQACSPGGSLVITLRVNTFK